MSTQPTVSVQRLQQAFEQSMSFQRFVDTAQVYQEQLRANFASFELSEQELAYFSSLPESINLLILAHDWCSDVASNLPLFAKIEQVTGKLHLHIINRDPDYVDIAEAYPHADGKSRIPTYLFFNHKKQFLGSFIERPDVITQYFPIWTEQFWDLHPEWDGRDKPVSELDESIRKALYAYYLSQRPSVQTEEKQAIIQIIQSIIKL